MIKKNYMIATSVILFTLLFLLSPAAACRLEKGSPDIPGKTIFFSAGLNSFCKTQWACCNSELSEDLLKDLQVFCWSTNSRLVNGFGIKIPARAINNHLIVLSYYLHSRSPPFA